MRAKLISGVIAALLLLPVAANADEHETDCYVDPTTGACVGEEPKEEEQEVLSEVEEREDEDEVVAEVQPVDVLGVSETALPDTGVDTWMILGLALGLLALGGRHSHAPRGVDRATRQRVELVPDGSRSWGAAPNGAAPHLL